MGMLTTCRCHGCGKETEYSLLSGPEFPCVKCGKPVWEALLIWKRLEENDKRVRSAQSERLKARRALRGRS